MRETVKHGYDHTQKGSGLLRPEQDDHTAPGAVASGRASTGLAPSERGT
jgi:hypothetical protein